MDGYCQRSAGRGPGRLQPGAELAQCGRAEAALQVMLPCKPDNAVRTVELAGAPLALSLLSCDADGANVCRVVRHANRPCARRVWRWSIGVLPRWRALAWRCLPRARPLPALLRLCRCSPLCPQAPWRCPRPVRTTVQGKRPDGTAVTAHAAWFARALGSEVRVYHAVVFADKARPAVADTFFAGLELR